MNYSLVNEDRELAGWNAESEALLVRRLLDVLTPSMKSVRLFALRRAKRRGNRTGLYTRLVNL